MARFVHRSSQSCSQYGVDIICVYACLCIGVDEGVWCDSVCRWVRERVSERERERVRERERQRDSVKEISLKPM